MNYAGLFEGISGFGLAFKRAGANVLAVCEIDKTCQSVLRRHHPEAEIISDVKAINKNTFEGQTVDILAGGFPCQDLSVAGLRKGLAGERSGLWFEFVRIIGDHQPRWIVIENVPGLLSSNSGRDFAVVLAGLTGVVPRVPESGWQNSGIASGYAHLYRVAWRVLDSQFDGVAQRRERVFIVASLGTASCAEILFERESGGWDSSPSREAGQNIAGTLAAGAHPSGFNRQDAYQSKLIPFGLIGNGEYSARPATLRAKGGDCGGGSEFLVAPTLRSNGDAHSGFTTGDGLVIGFRAAGQDGFTPSSIAPPIASTDGGGAGAPTVAYNLTFCDANGRRQDRPNGGLYVNETEKANTLTSVQQSGTVLANQFGVRRLTPTECERLQGFPDGHTAWGFGNKAISDSARYRMLGNAVCVPTAEWIARRIVKQMEVVA